MTTAEPCACSASPAGRKSASSAVSAAGEVELKLHGGGGSDARPPGDSGAIMLNLADRVRPGLVDTILDEWESNAGVW
jgi:hypothetical protein